MANRIRKLNGARNSWQSMHNRCRDPRNGSFIRYGAKGIKVCERWRSFENFLKDMGERPEGHTIDRIDASKDYSPLNCRWATVLQQARNKTSTRKFRVADKLSTIPELCLQYKIPYTAVTQRLKRGWAIERALTHPLRPDSELRRLSKKHGIGLPTLYYRVTHGWPLETALAVPAGKGHNGRNHYCAKKTSSERKCESVSKR